MNRNRVRKFVALGLLALPLIVVAMLALTWGNSSTQTTSAAVLDNPMHLEVKDGAKTCIDPQEPAGNICVIAGEQFVLSVVIDKFPPDPGTTGAGWVDAESYVDYDDTVGNTGALNYKKPAGGPKDDIKSPPIDCGGFKEGGQTLPGESVNHSCITTGLPPAPTTFTGQFVNMDFGCKAGNSVTVVTLGVGEFAGLVDSGGTLQFPATDSITIHCQVPPPTETPTATNTPTDTPTATPTNTLVSKPPFVKSPAVQNLWLTRQGAKIPPVQCIGAQGGDDTATFKMSLGTGINALDPKDLTSTKPVDLGAFEFQVNYDPQKVCVDINQTGASNHMTCFIEDSVSKQSLEGVARIGCITIGKKVIVDGIWQLLVTGPTGPATCMLAIVEAPDAMAALGITPKKGTMIATSAGIDMNPALPGVQSCVGTTTAFGWIAPNPQYDALGDLVVGFDNETGELVGIIPCLPPNFPTLCKANGAVTGTFANNEFDGAFTATLGEAFRPLNLWNVTVQGTISGSRVARIPLDLAKVVVRPQPDVYSQGKANQDNGVVVQLTNKKCELADLQGHPIPEFSCDDADVTIRYLEADVEPDCVIDTLDTQAIAFRWGSNKGSLIYNDRFNLEPSGAQADSDIDIKDLQFVYGRFGSTCADPHPPQPPVNKKA